MPTAKPALAWLTNGAPSASEIPRPTTIPIAQINIAAVTSWITERRQLLLDFTKYK